MSGRAGAMPPPIRSILPLYLGFLVCGAVTVLLGLLLPRLAALYGLSDRQSGMLLMAQFGASASGALLVRRHLVRSLVAGYGLLAVGALALGVGPLALAVPEIAVAALGLGMAMTSTSILVGRLFVEGRGSALSVLNFCWSVGAMLCPFLIAPLPARFSLAVVGVPIGCVAGGFAVAVLPGARSVPGLSRDGAKTPTSGQPLRLLLHFAAIAFLYVGAEATVGSWMSTYAGRAVTWNFTRSNLAAGCFWAMLLVGRGLTPVLLRWLTETALHRLGMVVALVGVSLLVAAHSPWLLLAAACCAGLAFAPIFPLTISLLLGQVGESPDAGWVFAAAGYGGMVFPLLTGLISSGAYSLRLGLLVAVGAVVGMLALALRLPAVPSAARHDSCCS